MDEMIEAGSPDSGYMTNSPRCLQADKGPLAETLLPATEKVNDERCHRLRVRSDRLVSDLKAHEGNGRPDGFDGSQVICKGKTPTCCKHHQQEDSAGGSSISSPSLRTVIRRRKTAKQHGDAEETASPVLGIRILPIEAFDFGSGKKLCVDDDLGKRSPSNSTEQSGTCAEVVWKTGKADEPGEFTCRLCSKYHEDAFQLAQHQCPRIVNIRYECSECGKVFGCPANLASHKRWHKPKGHDAEKKASSQKQPKNKKQRLSAAITVDTNTSCDEDEHNASFPINENEVKPFPKIGLNNSLSSPTDRVKAIFPCPACKRRFRRDANRRKHALVKHGLTLPATIALDAEGTYTAAAINVKPESNSREVAAVDPRGQVSLALPPSPEAWGTKIEARDNAVRNERENELLTDAAEGDTKPLDLTVKTKELLLRHSVAEIMKPVKLDTQISATNGCPQFSLEDSCADGALPISSRAFAFPSGFVRIPPVFPSCFVSWSAKPNLIHGGYNNYFSAANVTHSLNRYYCA